MRNTRTKMKAKHAGYKSPTDNQLMDYIYLSSSSSVSSLSSNLSPLAPPFTVERSNNKLNSNQNPDPVWPNYHSPLTTTTTSTQGFATDSIRTATTLPYANSTPSPHNNWSSMDSSFKLGRKPINGNLFSSNASIYFNNPFNPPDTTNNWFSNPNPNNETATHNWSSMNSNIKLGLEPVNQPADHLFGVKPNNQLPTSWNFGDDSDDDDDGLLNPNDFHLFRDDGPSQIDYGISLSGLKYSGPVNGSRGKDDSMFGGVSGFLKENNIGPSTIGKSHDTSFSASNHGFVSSGFSKEDTFTWNGQSSSRFAFETRPLMYDTSSEHISTSMTRSSPSVVIKPPVTLSSFSAQGAVSTKSIEISTPSKYSNKILVSHNPSKEKESHPPLGFEAKESYITSNLLNLEIDEPNKVATDRLNFEFKASSNFQVPDINTTKDVNSAANLSENLDHHNSSEDSPCWKGAPTQFPSPGSSVAESSQLPMKKLQKGNGEDVLLPEMSIQTTDGTPEQNKHATVATAATFVGAEMLDVDFIVKALSNLSELLLLQCSKDKCGLKEQDCKALEHVIGNFNTCMSRKPQQVEASPSYSERNNTHTADDIKELQNTSLRDDDLTKDYNMIQTIKKVLDENLEGKEDLSSESLLYKNLWLEAEAELCTSSYRARFHRAKKEMGKSKASGSAKVLYVSEVASDIKKIPSSICSPIALKSIPEAAGSKTSNAHSPNPSLPRVGEHIDDIESSVMARFNILKQRGESIPVSVAEKEPATVEASGAEIHSSGVARELHLHNHLGEDDAVVMNSHGNQRMEYPLAVGREDLEQSVRARLNILKRRGEADPVNLEREVLADGPHAGVSAKESRSCGIIGPHFQHQAGKEEEIASGSAGGTSLMLNRFESGLYTTYGASSDWEYVEKK